MTTRDLLIELLAIKIYEQAGGQKWLFKREDEREALRALVRQAKRVGEIYDPPGTG